MALPFLPGNSFKDPTKTRFHVSQTLNYKNGYALPSRPRLSVGGQPLPQGQLTEAALDELASTQPTLTYGRAAKPAPVEFVPAHVAFDKKVLMFDAYFKQTVHESPGEHYRIREVKIYYYLEDDSISVVEPPVENSGVPQGKLIKRQRIPCNEVGDLWHWKNLNLGIDVVFYGKVFHIVDCDQYTSILHYFLVDDTLEIREIHEPNDGRDPYPILLCRQRLPKDRYDLPSNFPAGVMEASEHELVEWFSPKDFGIGKTIIIMGRKFLFYDCDEFTKEFYRTKFNVQDFTPIQVKQLRLPSVQQPLPPYNGFGSLEDSKQSCLSLIPQPPKKDFIKMLENDGKVLRFAAVMDSSHPEDEHRKFIISYYLSDDTLTIFEPPQRNAGILGGKFLERMRVAHPGSSTDSPTFYRPQDFAIGAIIEVLKHKFILTDADEYVLKYMEANAEDFPTATLESLRKKHRQTSSS